MTLPDRLVVRFGEQSINLTQVLKLANRVQSGGEAKSWIAQGFVKVNGEVEFRKRRQMKPGDTIDLENGTTIVLAENEDRPPSDDPAIP